MKVWFKNDKILCQNKTSTVNRYTLTLEKCALRLRFSDEQEMAVTKFRRKI